MTRDDILNAVTPYVRAAVEARVSPLIPFGRAIATKDITTHIRLALDAALGRFGPGIVAFLDAHVPDPEAVFAPSVAQTIRGLRELCATPLSDLDPVAAEARAGVT